MNEEEEDPRWGGGNYELVTEYRNGDLHIVVYRYKDSNRYKFVVYKCYYNSIWVLHDTMYRTILG